MTAHELVFNARMKEQELERRDMQMGLKLAELNHQQMVAAICTARQGVGATPKPFGATSGFSPMNTARHSPAAMRLSESRKPCRSLDARGDQSEARPGVQPAAE